MSYQIRYEGNTTGTVTHITPTYIYTVCVGQLLFSLFVNVYSVVSNIAFLFPSEDTVIKFMTDGVLLREVETVGGTVTWLYTQTGCHGYILS